MTARDTRARRSGVARLTKARPQGQKSLFFRSVGKQRRLGLASDEPENPEKLGK